MGTTKLKLYNGALRILGERKLASLTENRAPRRYLDDVWDDNLMDAVLGEGQWMFACRTMALTYSPSVEPPFGYKYTFDKPADLVRTVSLCSDEYFSDPLVRYQQEGAYWFADLQTIYIRYVSNDASYGGNLLTWPDDFCRFVQAYLAREICVSLEQSQSMKDKAIEEYEDRLRVALSKDAMEEPTRFMPHGSWVRSRMSGRGWNGPR